MNTLKCVVYCAVIREAHGWIPSQIYAYMYGFEHVDRAGVLC